MKRTKLRLGALILLAIAALLLSTLNSCDLSNDKDDAEETAGVTASQLAGTWLATFETLYEYDEGSYADTMIMDFSDNNYALIFYRDTVQNGGNRGTFALSGSTITLNVADDWNGEEYWVSGTGSYPLPFGLSGSVLTVTGPGGQVIPLAKTAFSRPAALVGYWEYANGMTLSMDLAADGTYTYEDPDYFESGVDWRVSGTSSGYLRTSTTVQDILPVSIDCLTPYEYSSEYEELTLTYGSEGDFIFTLGSPPV